MGKQALVLIDLQKDYFPGGKWTLHNVETAAKNAAAILQSARTNGDLIVHVHHEFLIDEPPFFAPQTEGAEIHPSVAPGDGEQTVLKHQVNAFHQTNLKELLDANKIEDVTFVGAMSHMCIDSAARSASDQGFNVTVVEDACASRNLDFDGQTIEASNVHAAYMSALSFAFANVVSTEAYLK